ncbi:glycosyl hydrolase family 18 protein [Kitasatospora saccharophila]|uniref:Glycosyl hydrolase family 18 protein n=1 Tax=Kitasatospora saccharophila TaxID=407973 RepID=A0ABN2X4A7_9ACTN
MTGPVRRPLRALLAGVLGVTALAGLTLTGTGTASAAGTPLPARVFAPYFDARSGDSLATVAARSGNAFVTLGPVHADAEGSCTPYWNGDPGTPAFRVDEAPRFTEDIGRLRAAGGDAVLSFGGYAADRAGTEIADSCTDAGAVATAFQNVVLSYGVSRIDLDVEDASLADSAGIDRRNKAIKLTEDWAASTGRGLQFSYTLPTTPAGLTPGGLAVLQNALCNGARIDVVNLLTFDYRDGPRHDMAADTRTAAQGLHDQLQRLYPARTDAQLWGSIGITEMIGVDHYGPAETFGTADAAAVESWAEDRGIGTLSFRSLQRDNGGCPGTAGSDSCSGTAQDNWQFSRAFQPFTDPPPVHHSPSPTPSSPSPSITDEGPSFLMHVSRDAGSAVAGSSVTTTVSAAVNHAQVEYVAVGVSGLPAGVTASINPSVVFTSYPGNQSDSAATLTLVTSAATAPGTYQLAVTGRGNQFRTETTYTLTVVSPVPPPPCALATWNPARVYTGGDTVSWTGHNWQAKWWTQGERPGVGGEWGSWKDLGTHF